MRKGMAKGYGKGYRNVISRDPLIHSQSAKGMKQPDSTFLDRIFPQPKPLKTVPKLNVSRYMGRWYDIAHLPAWFQSGLRDVTAEYEKKKGYIKVKNAGVDEEGMKKLAYAKAYPVDSTNARLKVDFGFIFDGDYHVIYVDKGYNNAIVGTPDRNYLWILSRKPSISKSRLTELKSKAKSQGFDIKELQKTKQSVR